MSLLQQYEIIEHGKLAASNELSSQTKKPVVVCGQLCTDESIAIYTVDVPWDIPLRVSVASILIVIPSICQFYLCTVCI